MQWPGGRGAVRLFRGEGARITGGLGRQRWGPVGPSWRSPTPGAREGESWEGQAGKASGRRRGRRRAKAKGSRTAQRRCPRRPGCAGREGQGDAGPREGGGGARRWGGGRKAPSHAAAGRGLALRSRGCSPDPPLCPPLDAAILGPVSPRRLCSRGSRGGSGRARCGAGGGRGCGASSSVRPEGRSPGSRPGPAGGFGTRSASRGALGGPAGASPPPPRGARSRVSLPPAPPRGRGVSAAGGGAP